MIVLNDLQFLQFSFNLDFNTLQLKLQVSPLISKVTDLFQWQMNELTQPQ